MYTTGWEVSKKIYQVLSRLKFGHFSNFKPQKIAKRRIVLSDVDGGEDEISAKKSRDIQREKEVEKN